MREERNCFPPPFSPPSFKKKEKKERNLSPPYWLLLSTMTSEGLCVSFFKEFVGVKNWQVQPSQE
jgi:hypothetical protein